MIEELRNKAKELLKTGQVERVVGYARAPDKESAIPCIVSSAEGTDRLIWDDTCVYNLALYLKDFRGKRTAVVAKACDAKAIVVLLQENQLKREEIFIIGVECFGMAGGKAGGAGAAGKCASCASSVPTACDLLIKDKSERAKAGRAAQADQYGAVRALEAKPPAERLKFWEEEFSRCIRCYACRQVCPMCYCPTCVADQTMPAWFPKSSGLKGNFSWNVTRAMHLAARCIDCGECERACPVGIPLRELNKKIEKDIKELFGYEAGRESGAKPFLACFDKDDPGTFIK